jgi:hypothetical protein
MMMGTVCLLVASLCCRLLLALVATLDLAADGAVRCMLHPIGLLVRAYEVPALWSFFFVRIFGAIIIAKDEVELFIVELLWWLRWSIAIGAMLRIP